jgi:hypothetical protein
MEEIKSSIRPFKVNDHHKQNLKGTPLYYRVGLNSAFRRAGTTVTDATFDVSRVFPNQRADLLNGEWQVFLESFEGQMASQLARTNIKVCLPDLVKSSQDYVMTSATACQVSDAIGHVPITQEYRAPGHADGAAVPVDALASIPIAVSKVIGADSVGVKVDPVALFAGQLRILLRDEHHAPIVEGGTPPEMPDTEGWRATILFVHKAFISFG